jgi:hypothetical protein
LFRFLGRAGRVSESFVDNTTQLWVRLTGRRVRLLEQSWLEGPIGDTDVIGENFFHRLAEREGLFLDAQSPVRGLLPNIAVLDGPRFKSTEIDARVADFYQRTSLYSFGVSSRWSGGLRPFARLISLLFSRRLRQLNVPLSDEEARGGATSEVFLAGRDAQHTFSAWIRTLKSTGNTLYAGAYSTTKIPGHDSPCIKVVFPLPKGSAIVIMRPELQEDGSLLLCSDGQRFGDPGFYFYVSEDRERGFARYVRALQETIRVYPGTDADVLAHHEVKFWGIRFLRQNYCMRA